MIFFLESTNFDYSFSYSNYASKNVWLSTFLTHLCAKTKKKTVT